MNRFTLFLLSLVPILTLLACQKIQNETQDIDTKSYINDFELTQTNNVNNTIIKITSPKAIIDQYKNNIEIFDNLITVINKDDQDVKVKSGNSSLNNATNLIRVYNNVNISLVENDNYFISTDSFNWDLKSENIKLNNSLDINFDDTRITSLGGSYNINSNLLIINDNIYKRSVFNSDGEKKYKIKILSDIASWSKKENLLEFTSNNKQVETTIDFLSIK